MVNKKITSQSTKLSLKEKILKLLIEDKTPKTILQIAEILNVDYKNTFQELNKLYPVLIYKNKIGSINLIEIKLASSPEIYSIECRRTKQFLEENKSLILIKKDIESLNYPFFIVL